MNDARIASLTRGKLVKAKIAGGMSAADASEWADANLKDALTKVKSAKKGTDPFAKITHGQAAPRKR